MAKSRSAKVAAFRATLPPEDSELVICPPDCKIWHDDGRWPGAAKKPEIVLTAQQVSSMQREHAQPFELVEDSRSAPKRVTAKTLEHHARMFGPEEVQNVADALGIQVDLTGFKSPADELRKKKRKTRPVRKDIQARKYLERGMSWPDIEDALNLNRYTSMQLKAVLEEQDRLAAQKEVA